MPYSKVKIYVPDIKSPFKQGSYNYSNPSTKADNIAMVKRIDAAYGGTISYWGFQFDIPKGVIVAFIATESGGQMLKPNRYSATGLMQVTPNAIWDCARKWSSEVDVPLPTTAKNLLTQKIPDFFTSKSATPSSSQRTKILTALEKDANFNIMAGTLVLRWLIERFSTFLTGGQLNKAMVAYNAGAYLSALQVAGTRTTPNQVPIDSTALATNSRVPAESRAYLYKMMGTDGFLALIYKDKAIQP